MVAFTLGAIKVHINGCHGQRDFWNVGGCDIDCCAEIGRDVEEIAGWAQIVRGTQSECRVEEILGAPIFDKAVNRIASCSIENFVDSAA